MLFKSNSFFWGQALAGLITCTLCRPLLADSTVLNLVYPEFRPYQYYENGKHKGVGFEVLRLVMAELGQNFSVESVPSYRRAEVLVSKGHSDGFFLASQNEVRDSTAVLSKPLLTNNWVWVYRTGEAYDSSSAEFKSEQLVTTILHTNTHHWLYTKGYQNISALLRPKLLPRLLDISRTDGIFISEEVFWYYADKQGYKRERFSVDIEQAKPFGIYISKRYLDAHPEFMDKLNNAIDRVRADFEV